MHYKEVNLEEWNRAKTYLLFKNYEQPQFNITGNVDIGPLKAHCSKKGESFFLNCMFYSMLTANSIPEFRMRVKDDKVIIYDTVYAGSTILKADNTFGFCYFPFTKNKESFLDYGLKEIEREKGSKILDPKSESNNLIYHSVIPWISFTSFSHARMGGQPSTIPQIVFGKYFRKGDSWKMPLSIEANHSIMDGYHVGLYFQKFEEMIQTLNQ